MKPWFAFLIISACLSSLPATAQYYIRGEVRDEKNNPLENVNIYQYSSHLIFHSGASGSFGITATQLSDSLLFYVDGYEPVSLRVKTTEWLTVKMKSFTVASSSQKTKLLSLTKDLPRETKRNWFYSNESYATLIENNFVDAHRYPLTSLVLNVDKASYSNVRRMLNSNSIVPPDAVRVEEMLNYFNFGYEEPDSGQIFKLSSRLAPCPWNEKSKLFYLHVSAKKANLEKVPPSNLVFLIDVSGSMDLPNKLPLLKSAFKLLANNLRAEDTVSIVIYGGAVGVMLYPTSGGEKQKILDAIDALEPGGDTPGESAIRTAYALAKRSFIKDGNNRVILATDGDFNVGINKEEELENLIVAMRQSGVFLTCLGVGMGNYKDSKLYVMAKKGNGNIAYIDNLAEAEKVLVEEFFQTIYAVAEDVVMKVQFNHHWVSDYRLIGFDNKKTTDEKFITSDELEGGEVGSGHSVMAVFEMKMRDKDNTDFAGLLKDDILACIDINYKKPADSVRYAEAFTADLQNNDRSVSEKEYQFANCVLMFASLLRQSGFIGELEWSYLLSSTKQSVDPANKLQAEFLQLVQQAMKLYKDPKKKKKKKEEAKK